MKRACMMLDSQQNLWHNAGINMRKVCLLLCLVSCFSFAKVFAVDILHMKTFTDKDGLSQNTIYHIFQDRQGFMWINAAKWINRYDGQEFRTLWSEKDEEQQSTISPIW